jgi:hypothetical protein
MGPLSTSTSEFVPTAASNRTDDSEASWGISSLLTYGPGLNRSGCTSGQLLPVSKLWIWAGRPFVHPSSRLHNPSMHHITTWLVPGNPNLPIAYNDECHRSDKLPPVEPLQHLLDQSWLLQCLDWLEHPLQLVDHHFPLAPCPCPSAPLIPSWNSQSPWHRGTGLEVPCIPPISSAPNTRPARPDLEPKLR